ncbi:MAG TPA: hypothetical protein VFX16_32915 [Pseudonocardiaceae bacterium]|nr:hypothetical protein [Pseudonocardiaceae bacterium]
MRVDHRFPAYAITRLVTATAVLRLVASDRLDDGVRDLLGGDAPLDDLIADTTGICCPDAVGELVLAPLGMTGSSFSVRPSDAVTGYRLASGGMFEPVGDEVDGLWTTAADLVRFGIGWSSLLPEELVREVLTPQGGRGLGWPLDRAGEIAGSPGRGEAGSVSLVVRRRDRQTHVAMTTRRIPVEPINGQLLRHS